MACRASEDVEGANVCEMKTLGGEETGVGIGVCAELHHDDLCCNDAKGEVVTRGSSSPHDSTVPQ